MLIIVVKTVFCGCSFKSIIRSVRFNYWSRLWLKQYAFLKGKKIEIVK